MFGRSKTRPSRGCGAWWASAENAPHRRCRCKLDDGHDHPGDDEHPHGTYHECECGEVCTPRALQEKWVDGLAGGKHWWTPV